MGVGHGGTGSDKATQETRTVCACEVNSLPRGRFRFIVRFVKPIGAATGQSTVLAGTRSCAFPCMAPTWMGSYWQWQGQWQWRQGHGVAAVQWTEQASAG